MSKQNYRDRGMQGLTVKKRTGRRAFSYQVRQKWLIGSHLEQRSLSFR
jgi:hypothetical protein